MFLLTRAYCTYIQESSRSMGLYHLAVSCLPLSSLIINPLGTKIICGSPYVGREDG